MTEPNLGRYFSLIEDIVQKLKAELGEDANETEVLAEKTEKPQKVLITPEPINIDDEIKTIDMQLNNSSLTPEQVDRLLDRRSDLARKKATT